MKTLKLTISLAIFLITLNGVMAMASYCGDGVCTNAGDYTEGNPLTSWFCPLDCGDIITSRWCEDTYNLTTVRDCPTCTTCPTCGSTTCDTSRISTSELNNWCTSTGYSKSQPLAITGTGTGDSTINNYWIIFLIIGGVIGFIISNYYKKNKRRR